MTWIAHPEESMARASHAVAVDGETWVVEPVGCAGLDDLLDDLGPVGGVVVLADYHRRDAAAIARRHDVAVHLPSTVAGLAADVAAPVEPFDGELADTGIEPLALYGGVPWREAALYRPGDGTLVATEALCTSPSLTAGERLAVTPYVRLAPPRAALGGLAVERVLSGHGPPMPDETGPALERALADARRGTPAALVDNLSYLLRAAWAALRT